ncbi:MAG: polymer-forming cytoskeletal protein [Planctomycetes bacterium]|nr:polymer-forming cytoskeletal protein [Planctomycetota bacterium]
MFGPKSKKLETTAPATEAARFTANPEERVEDRKIAPTPPSAQNVIGKGTVIEGNIVAEGDLLIEGTVRGDVTTKTNLIVGPTCVIEGNIVADHAEVAGQVKGTVQALGLLIIKSSSMIDGDVLTKNLNVESGSTFNGRFTVGSVTNSNGSIRKTEPTPSKTEFSVLGGEVRRPAAATTAPSKV